jgi:hypothetical protein
MGLNEQGQSGFGDKFPQNEIKKFNFFSDKSLSVKKIYCGIDYFTIFLTSF